MLESGLVAVLLVSAGIQCVYALLFWIGVLRARAHWSEPLPEQGELPPLSVIICAHNEGYHLSRNLPHVLAQRYHGPDGAPAYEVIVIDDASTDRTAGVLRKFAVRHPHLRVHRIEPFEPRELPGKKFALSRAVELAQHPLLVMMDGDCVPASYDWLRRIAAPLTAGKVIVAGYGQLYPVEGAVESFAQWETMHTFLQARAWASLGLPYLAVGRDMATTRAAYDRARRHPAWTTLPSGDDDLLVMANASAHNYAVVIHPEAATYSLPKRTLREYIRQKRRHLSTGKFYKSPVKAALGGYALTHGLGWLTALLCFLFAHNYWGLLVFAIRCAMVWSLWAREAWLRRERTIMPALPLMDFGWAVYNLFFSPYIFWKSKQEWT